MHPLLSIVAPVRDTAHATSVVAQLISQSYRSWELILVGEVELPSMAAFDARVSTARVAGGRGAKVTAGVEAARGSFVMVLGDRSKLRPGALGALAAEAEGLSANEGVYGRHVFESPIGVIPGDPTQSVGEQLTIRHWASAKASPMSAMLTPRSALAHVVFDEALGGACEWDVCVKLAGKGVRWSRCEEIVVAERLAVVATGDDLLTEVRAHREVASRAAAMVGWAEGRPECVPASASGSTNQAGWDPGLPMSGSSQAAEEAPERESELVQAFDDAERRLRLLRQAIDAKTRFKADLAMPWRLVQWWGRFGFFGPVPQHLVDEVAWGTRERHARRLVPRAERRPVDVLVASYRRPDRLSAMIESVRATGYPARVLVGAGDPSTVETCEKYPQIVECLFSTDANRKTGCTAPLNLVFTNLVKNDVIFCTDDCVFSPDAIDRAMETLYTLWPDGDGVVGLAQENIPNGYELAFPLIGKRFAERFARHGDGDLFYPGYFHMYNDAEIGVTIKCLGNWVFEPSAKLRHFHPCTGVAEDATHARGRTFGQRDVELWHQRRVRGVVWGIDG